MLISFFLPASKNNFTLLMCLYDRAYEYLGKYVLDKKAPAVTLPLSRQLEDIYRKVAFSSMVPGTVKL